MRLSALILFLLGALFVQAREIPVTIITTTDLHSHILPTVDYEGQTNRGGLARCATAIKQIRASVTNSLLVDAGDTIQGAAVGYLSDGQVMVKAFNYLHYDAWVWGNHEFDWGVSKLAACASRAEVPMLVANLQGTGSSNDSAKIILDRIKPYRLLKLDGVMVAVIGLTTPGVPHWSRPSLLTGLKVTDSLETLKAIVPEVRRVGAQVLVLVCHQGYRESGDDHASQINAIARNFPELDVIIGGHSHRNFPEYKIDSVLYCQAGYHGMHLGRVDLVFDTAKGRVTHRESRTVLMDDHTPPDAELLKLCQPELDKAAASLSEVLGEAKEALDSWGGPKHETQFHGLIYESIASALQRRGVKADVIIHGLLEQQRIVKKGPITANDIWGIIPYENTLGTLRLHKSQLLEILEENAAAYDKREFRGIWGLRWKFNPKASAGQRTLSLTHADGSPINEDEVLTVVCNSYDLASGGLRWKKLREIADRPESQLTEYPIQTREAVFDYIRREKIIAPVIQGWWQTPGRTKSE